MGDLSPYLEDTQFLELRTIPFEEGEDDQDQETDTVQELFLSRHEIKGFSSRPLRLHWLVGQGHCFLTW